MPKPVEVLCEKEGNLGTQALKGRNQPAQGISIAEGVRSPVIEVKASKESPERA